MKRILLIFLSFCVDLSAQSALCQENDSQELLLFWNLENLFDYKDDGLGTSDAEFSSAGQRRWTKGRFYRKCNMIAKSILWTSQEYGYYPGVIGIAEIENEFVVKSLIYSTCLRKLKYGYVHYDSSDPRGIDVALLYDRKSYELLSSRACHIRDDEGNVLKTRDILCVVLRGTNGKETAFLVNHHPSKYGGEEISRKKRARTMNAMLDICDSLKKAGIERIIAMGDFNDGPFSEAMKLIEGKLVNKAEALALENRGTIRYQGKWELIDMFLVNPEIDGDTDMNIIQIPFLMEKDSSHPGFRPLRTYSGPRYKGGVSDHLPILLKF